MDCPGESTARSLLDKPLGELTEDDVSQLTREDCRKFLKDKGMRRPSWNKSQAIQQVISLKSLLEVQPVTGDDDDDESDPKPTPVSVPLTRAGARCGDLAPSPYRRRDRAAPVITGGDPAETRCQVEWPINPASAGEQLTIFYGGVVNVYEGVAAEKARTLLQLAARPGFDDRPLEVLQSSRSLPCPPGQGWNGGFGGPSGRAGGLPISFRESAQDWRTLRETDPESPTGREVSLQRYLVKRKERFKGKRALGTSYPSNRGMMCVTQNSMVQNANEQSTRGDMNYPNQPRPPRTPTKCSSIENKASKLHHSFDLNEDGDDN